MKEKNEKYLVENFPKLFHEYGRPVTISCMGWGLECGDGWFQLVKGLCKVIDWRNQQLKEKDRVHFTQIKEKWGVLTVYTNLYDAYVDGAIAMAEIASASICEVCGQPGKINNQGWRSVTCETCRRDKYACCEE